MSTLYLKKIMFNLRGNKIFAINLRRLNLIYYCTSIYHINKKDNCLLKNNDSVSRYVNKDNTHYRCQDCSGISKTSEDYVYNTYDSQDISISFSEGRNEGISKSIKGSTGNGITG